MEEQGLISGDRTRLRDWRESASWREIDSALVRCCLADGACSQDEITTLSKCLTDKGSMTATDTAGACKWIKEYWACYPKCYCDDATYKASIDATIKAYEAYKCSGIKCGSAAGLRASAFSVFVAAVVALVTAH